MNVQIEISATGFIEVVRTQTTIRELTGLCLTTEQVIELMLKQYREALEFLNNQKHQHYGQEQTRKNGELRIYPGRNN